MESCGGGAGGGGVLSVGFKLYPACIETVAAVLNIPLAAAAANAAADAAAVIMEF